MQDALIALTRYWTDRGAMMVQPFNTEVGAGTLNPATVLRVLGPEPWRVAYTEPSVRPDDARYGENPNRLQTHTQFQVILKPDPGDPQEVYLGSLAALGIDVREHDVRFVEDNWASPAIGSWGLGWEVWLNGLEITQFTYFQQAAGTTLDPVSVEITYGMERIIMALQKVRHFKDIAYAPGLSYGEVFGQTEYEMSRYYLDDADIDTTRRLFEEYAAEAKRMVDARLPMPAYYCVLKCSHTFNILDSRGAISTTERARAFTRMRNLTRDAATLWSERRAEQEHPLGVVAPLPAAVATAPVPQPAGPATLLFEIGTEELPAATVTRSAAAVRSALTEKLAATKLAHGEIRTYATPRRIVALIDAVAPREPDTERFARGPKVAAAFDADGAPTKAAAGFARGQGVDVAELQRTTVDGVEYVGVQKTDTGRGAGEVLTELLGSVVTGLRAEKNMRWADPELSFSRPIRWLLALLGDAELPVVASALAAGRDTRVHRNAAEPVVRVPDADGYLEFLAGHGVIADPAVRREEIVRTAGELAAKVGGTVDFDAEAALLAEVTNLVEQPHVLLGEFDAGYLELPQEILTTVMRKHQRYLPVRDERGALMPFFVTVANGECDEAVVRAGNEDVLHARYEDAAFFWRADREVAPETFHAGLAQLAFEERLGSMAARAARIGGVAVALGGHAGLNTDAATTLDRAAQLVKFDLASKMVVELTSLAGVMAREYASHAGETPAVATALFEVEQPRSTTDTVPATVPGALLALGDRLDLLVGLFAIGATPKGSSDPFGLRRAALGVVSILRAHPDLRRVTLSAGIAAAAEQLRAQDIEVSEQAITGAREFVVGRFEQQLLDTGADHRFVAAALPLADVPMAVDDTLATLRDRASDEQFAALVAAVQRVRRIVPDGTPAGFASDALREPAETELAETVTRLRPAVSDAHGLAGFATAAAPLIAPVNRFFDDILVMADDEAVRAARLGLLATVLQLADGVLDWPALGSALSR